ncbi:hypothetical protein P4U99_27505 [Brevibacillus agri]|uniref:hypothetical protein n=1 Tax=Brevibacillus agri TaxID=51101 RepID=UPI0025B6AB41|nr:hypothetical protein [Brevibacillus agri]MDN4094764.1 hypothetical protein [Brevibacillus agri]MED1646854.1 hypothetical protein [Brevibacillus agri]MED1657681.1 hypothetical protein [Brevibacillus agri]MED1689875.1 hypothetical protein [Brevibacillus agri]MED1694469.1 hypothetical protein [Brevibacillus agri]
MNLVKKSLVSMGLLAVFACSAAVAYAAPISFETSSTQIVFDNKNGKWASQAYTKGSYGTQYSRTYTEIYGDGYKRDWKKSDKVKGRESQAVAYANTGFASYEAESDHRIWWTQDDVDSIATHSDDSF